MHRALEPTCLNISRYGGVRKKGKFTRSTCVIDYSERGGKKNISSFTIRAFTLFALVTRRPPRNDATRSPRDADADGHADIDDAECVSIGNA